MRINEFNGRCREQRAVVPAGQSFVFFSHARDKSTIFVYPQGGGSAIVQISGSPLRFFKEEPASVKWLNSTMGTDGLVTSADSTTIPTPCSAFKVEAQGGDVVVEIQEI